MIGSEGGARRALAGELEQVGEGGQRRVYRDGETVYKVGNAEANRRELETAERLAGTPGVPEVTPWDVDGELVLAMWWYPPLAEVTRSEWTAMLALAELVGDADGVTNWRRGPDGPVLVDLAGRAFEFPMTMARAWR